MRWKVLAVLAGSCLAVLSVIRSPFVAWKLRPVGVPRKDNNYEGHRGQSHGAVASEAKACTEIGLGFLRQGGNAADALIGTAFCLGTVAMYHVGPGGGGFGLVRSRDGHIETVDFKERAPAAAFENMFVSNPDASITGGLASAVPGELRGLEYLHKRYASMSWSQLIEPSIELARDGFMVDEDLYMFMTMEENNFLRDDPSWAIDFAPGGRLKRVGEIMTRKRFANTLLTISKHGADSFYNGEIATSTIRAIQKANGTLTLKDLKDYKASGVPPVQITYRDFIIASNIAPGGGSQALSMMKTIEGYSDMGHPQNINLSTHRVNEAMRFSSGERVRLGDPDFNTSVTPFAEWMISDGAAQTRRAKISDHHTLPQDAYNPSGWGFSETAGTSATIAADKDGLTIAWTSTVNDFWGSHLCVPETGIIMNNIMNDFSIPGKNSVSGLPPSPVNYPQPRKRPLDAIANVIVTHKSNNTFYFATCTAGGYHILTTDVAMLWYVLDMNMSATDAINHPRLHDQLYPNQVEMDWSWDNGTVAFMRSLGHNVTLIEPGYSINQAVLRRWDGTFDAATEPNLANSYAGTV